MSLQGAVNAVPGRPYEYGGILPKGSTNVDAINSVLTELKDDGSLSEFAKQWLGGDPSAVPVLTP